MKQTIFSRQILDCNNNAKTGDEPLKNNSMFQKMMPDRF